MTARRTATGSAWQRRGGEALFERQGLSPLIGRLLSTRGVSSVEQAEAFLSGALECEHDPLLLPQIDAALDRIERAILGREQIAVFGDYDVDGITATAILVEGISSLGGKVMPRLPNRFVDGYGVNRQALADLRSHGVSLVITADCGISAADEIAYANEIGLDTIVVDHHSIPPQLPDAVALIDPKLDGCLYPSTELAACGLAYKLLIALGARLGREYDHRTHLDLVALGTVCDMAPLLGENRWLVRHGLKAVQRSGRPGLRALAAVSGTELAGADASTLGFRLGPRINAAGRLYDAGIAYELLTTPHVSRAIELAERLNEINAERQRLTVESVEIAQQLAGERVGEPVLLVGHRDIPQGIVGLVAAKLAETHGRPAFVYEQGEEHSRGSARGTHWFNVVEALQAAGHLMLRYGGHRQAGGFTIETSRLPALRQALNEHAALAMPETAAGPVIEYDEELDLEAERDGLARWLRFLEPFGQANPEPVFCARNLVVREARVVGADKRHLVLRLQSRHTVWRGIAFGLAPAAPRVGERLDVLFAYRHDDRGRPDLHIRDFAPVSG